MTKQTKQITFEGQTYTVPVWVKWVALDRDGEIFGYKTKPHLLRTSWDCDYDVIYITHVASFSLSDESWRDSLTEV